MPARISNKKAAYLLCVASAIALSATGAFAAGKSVDYPVYGGDNGGARYSTLTQITKGNVSKLKEAWRLELPAGALEHQPIVVGNVMYLQTTDQRILAVDAATGKQKWEVADKRLTGRGRGFAWWQDGADKRLIIGAGNFILAINADTGAKVTSFGANGEVDLRENLREPAAANNINQGSPVSIYKDTFVTAGGVSEVSPASPGDIRGWDVRTGKLKWTFHTIPHPGEYGYDTWPADSYKILGGANNWVGSVLDDQRGIVYHVTGSAADDFAGPERLGDNLFANSVIALDATTGKRLWHFQTVHHDLWDADFAAPPILMTVTRNGKKIDAVAASNKLGFIYIFDRVTGEPLFPIDEKAAPQNTNVPGDKPAATQPVPRLPAPVGRTSVTEKELTTRTPEAAAWALEKFKTFVNGPTFTPVQFGKETVVAPGFSGGVEWGGMAASPNGVLFANAENVIWTTAVTPPRPVPPNAPAGFRSAYSFSGYHKFTDPDGYPATAAPWGTLQAIDMNTGKYLWKIPYGEYPELVAKGLKDTGSENYGGPVVTATGLLFIGSGIADNKLRAYDSANGKLLWETVMPYNGSTPLTYMLDGKQYIAIGGSSQRNRKAAKQGAAYVAYALPN
jgi:quinoprotein glucose dehydrogenase